MNSVFNCWEFLKFTALYFRILFFSFCFFLISFFFLKVFFFFDVDHFKSLYWIWYNIASIYALIFWPWGMWDLYSPTRDRTCIPCIGWRSLNHWTTRKAPILLSYCEYFKLIILSLLLLIPHAQLSSFSYNVMITQCSFYFIHILTQQVLIEDSIAFSENRQPYKRTVKTQLQHTVTNTLKWEA